MRTSNRFAISHIKIFTGEDGEETLIKELKREPSTLRMNAPVASFKLVIMLILLISCQEARAGSSRRGSSTSTNRRVTQYDGVQTVSRNFEEKASVPGELVEALRDVLTNAMEEW